MRIFRRGLSQNNGAQKLVEASVDNILYGHSTVAPSPDEERHDDITTIEGYVISREDEKSNYIYNVELRSEEIVRLFLSLPSDIIKEQIETNCMHILSDIGSVTRFSSVEIPSHIPKQYITPPIDGDSHKRESRYLFRRRFSRLDKIPAREIGHAVLEAISSLANGLMKGRKEEDIREKGPGPLLEE